MNRLLIPTLSAVLTLILLCTALPAVAQQADGCDSISRHRKAWEIGVGIHGMQLTRFNVTGFSPGSNGGYRIDTDKRDVLFGGHLYLARELNSHFFLDLQGNADFTADPVRGGKEKRWTAMAGMGLQWRLGEYFRSPYIDPFLRAGANYLYKNFTVGYNGLERLNAEEMKWDLANDFDKEGSDRRHLLPLSVGAGVNLWLNDRLGLGLQADYLVMPYRRVSNAWQGNVRLLWRIGGKRKRRRRRCVMSTASWRRSSRSPSSWNASRRSRHVWTSASSSPASTSTSTVPTSHRHRRRCSTASHASCVPIPRGATSSRGAPTPAARWHTTPPCPNAVRVPSYRH